MHSWRIVLRGWARARFDSKHYIHLFYIQTFNVLTKRSRRRHILSSSSSCPRPSLVIPSDSMHHYVTRRLSLARDIHTSTLSFPKVPPAVSLSLPGALASTHLPSQYLRDICHLPYPMWDCGLGGFLYRHRSYISLVIFLGISCSRIAYEAEAFRCEVRDLSPNTNHGTGT